MNYRPATCVVKRWSPLRGIRANPERVLSIRFRPPAHDCATGCTKVTHGGAPSAFGSAAGVSSFTATAGVSVGAVDVDQLHVEHQGGVGGDGPHAARPVAQVGGDHEGAPAA